MYAVSQDYIAAMHAADTQHRITGYIDSVPFSGDDILDSSMSISNSCSSNEEVNIGYVNIGEMNATFKNLNIAKKTWKGRVIRPIAWLLVNQDNNIWESVPLGEFCIDSVQHTQSGVVVRAYDNMYKLTKACSTRFTNATPYEMLAYACAECGVSLGNTREQIEAMPNGAEVLTQYPESDIETWQDMLYWIAQTLGGFATAGRDGAIYIRQYVKTVVNTLSPKHRHDGCSFSDFETRYTGLSVVDAKKETTIYYSAEMDDALTYNLGDNPFLQYGAKEQVAGRCRAILSAIEMIDYTPFEATMIGDPAYDLGDVLIFEDGIADGTKICCVTSYTYKFHGQYTMSGAGKDPATASAKSKTDKNIAGLMDKVNKDTFRFDTVRNGRPVEVLDDQQRRILRADIMTKDNAQVKVDVQVHVDVTLAAGADQAVCSVMYQLDSSILQRYPVETWSAGRHILTLQLMLDISEQGFHVFDIFLRMSGGAIAIDTYDIQCIFSGIGIVADAGWSGRFDIEDDAIDIPIHDITYAGGTRDTSLLAVSRPLTIGVSDQALTFAVKDLTAEPIVDRLAFNKEFLAELTWEEIEQLTWAELYQNYIWGDV